MRKQKYIDGIRSLANVYSPSTFRKVLNQDSLSFLKNRFKKYKKTVFSISSSVSFGQLLQLTYNEMLKNYRNEYIYKNAIINKILLGKYSLNTTTLLNEFKIGKSIADVVLVNGEVKLYEIKTDLDNLNRLDNQLNDYKKVVEKIYIVTNSRYVDGLKQLYGNQDYGIIEFTDQKTLKTHKEASENKNDFDHKTIFKLLRKNEYINIINNVFGSTPNVPNTKIFRECLKKSEEINTCDFQKMAFEQIKKRKIALPQFLEDEKTPYELKYICYALDLNKFQYNQLYRLLEESF